MTEKDRANWTGVQRAKKRTEEGTDRYLTLQGQNRESREDVTREREGRGRERGGGGGIKEMDNEMNSAIGNDYCSVDLCPLSSSLSTPSPVLGAFFLC